jgi:hypothetical protein
VVIILTGNYCVYKDLFTDPMTVASTVTNRTILYHQQNTGMTISSASPQTERAKAVKKSCNN